LKAFAKVESQPTSHNRHRSVVSQFLHRFFAPKTLEKLSLQIITNGFAKNYFNRRASSTVIGLDLVSNKT